MATKSFAPNPYSRTASPAPQPRPVGGGAKKIHVDLSMDLDFDELFKSRLLFLVVSLVLLALAALMFARIDFGLNDLFDFSRIQYSVQKLISISAILYVFLFSLALACSAYYGFGLKKWQSLLMLPAGLVIAGVFSLIFPSFWPAFIAMALTLAGAAFFSSMAKEPNYTHASAAVGRALFIFLIVAALFAFASVSAQKDARFNQFIDGALSMLPQATQGLGSSLSTTIQSLDLNESVIKGLVTKDQLKSVTAQQYDAQRAALINETSGFIDKATMESLVKPYANLTTAQQDSLVNAYYEAVTKQLAAGAPLIKQQLAAQLSQMANQAANASSAQQLTPSAALVKEQILKMDQGKLIYDFFPIIIAFAIIALVSVMNFFVRIIATFFAWALYKLQP